MLPESWLPVPVHANHDNHMFVHYTFHALRNTADYTHLLISFMC